MENCLLVLIPPAWPTQSWSSLLLEISVDHPFRLPLSPKLLKQTNKPFFQSNPGHPKLQTWKLQGGISRNKESAKMFLTDSWDLNANLPGNYVDFLNCLLLSKKLSPRTIQGYQTSIADFLRFHTKENCNWNIFFNKLIKSFKSEAPRPKNVFP